MKAWLFAGLVAVGGCSGADQESLSAPSTAPAAANEPRVAMSRGGADRVGTAAPGWSDDVTWINTEPRSLDDLRGQVLLIRFWTDTCPFCRASAPALAQIDRDYRDRGVTVVGMYHPKPRGTERSAEQVAAVTEAWGWEFPVALDLSWSILSSFWLDTGSWNYTSVSFIIDRQGIIRYVHPGPEFHPDGPADHAQCRRDYDEIRATLDALLAEPLVTRSAS